MKSEKNNRQSSYWIIKSTQGGNQLNYAYYLTYPTLTLVSFSLTILTIPEHDFFTWVFHFIPINEKLGAQV
jgi:hypothetical protein